MNILTAIALGGELMSAPKPHVMMLGTFHMANPGLDIANVKVDDVTTPKRQAEITEVVKELAKFKPTKIVIEARIDNPKTMENYRAYLAGAYQLRANESEQLGFRLAKQSGHAAIYPVDIPGDFPFEAVQKLAVSIGKQKEIEDALQTMQGEVAKIDGWLTHGTILQTLKNMNAPSQVTGAQALYMRLAQFATPDNYAGPDLLSEWYKRNIRIWANIRSLIESPNERILVIYGAGHSYWFERNVLDSGDLILDRF